MPFSDLFNSVIGYFTSDKQAQALNASLKAFQSYLNSDQNKKIRMWVPSTTGYGHQSSTVNLIFQLTNDVAKNGFGYAGIIEVYYSDAYPDTLQKLFQLMPQLNNQATGGKINNATVNLIAWTSGTSKPPADQVNLAFNGGNEVPLVVTNLNSRFYLQIQPYMWRSEEEIQFLSDPKKPVVLTDQRLLNYKAFAQRAYWMDLSNLAPDWTYYSANGYKNQVEVLQSVLAKIDDGSYDVGLAYSIRQNSELRSPPQERMFDVITGYMASQMSGTAPRAGAKPIIVLSMDSFMDGTGGKEVPLSQLINGGYTAQESEWNRVVLHDKSTEKIDECVQLLKPGKYRSKYLSGVNAGERVDYVWDATLGNVQAKYSWLSGAKNNVLFIQVGRVPTEIFNYLMSKITLPSIFEGQNTANLAMQIGSSYFHVARPSNSTVQYPTTLLGYSLYDEYADYNNVYMPVVYVPSIVYKMQDIANNINFPLVEWPSNSSNSPAEIMGAFIRDYMSSATGPYRDYYTSVKTFYQNPANDKFRVAASYLGYILQSKKVITPATVKLASAAAPAAGDTNPLNDLLGKLYDNLGSDKVLNLFPGVYSAGPIFDFISGLLGVAVQLTDATIDPAKGTTDPSKITVNGNFVFQGVPLAFTITFTAPDGSVVSDWKMVYTGTWLTQQMPWLLFEKPYVLLTVADTIVPQQGGVGGILQGLDLDLSIRLPIEAGVWQLEGHFAEPASVSKFYQLAGGVNLVQSLPSPFNAFTAIGVTDCQMAYDSNAGAIQYVSFVMATSESVKLMQQPALVMDSITFNVIVENPGSVADRKTKWSLKGKFTIGTGEDAGVIITGMDYPGPVITGQLVSGVIKVTDLFNLFLPGTVFDPQGYTPVVTEFTASFDGTTGDYNVVCNLNFDWTFQIVSGAPSITINGVGVRVQSQNKQLEGGISGGFTFGKGDNAFSITLSASYTSTGGWLFTGIQSTDSVLNLSAIANELLPSNWQIPPQYDYSLKNLNFKFEEKTKYYEIGGETAGYWTIPFINMNVRADLKFGYGLYGTDSSQSSSSTKALQLASGSKDEPKAGYYCDLNADIEWIGIKMKVFYNYNPDILKFGFTWGILTGYIEEKQVEVKGKQETHWIGTLKFTDSVTLGSIIEDAISWFTGYKYGLGAPWSLLNSLSLNNLELVYDFTAKTVSFKVDIGEINLGFCKINKIGINYASGNADTSTNGVFITIDGSFFWLAGSQDPNENENQINWDASKPEKTPSPSGQGNKYFDLRLLALGQHVTIPGFSQVTSVQEAIDAMSKLPETEPGQIPGITFDANSSWLVGMDFGVLKLQDDKSGGGSGGNNALMLATDSGNDGGDDYFINLQIVFNDPNLYALRIKLSGEPARIFKGLDFQIMYRKISDSVGVYQAEITLPDIMRKIQLGQVNITLPVFGIEIYTNGDFLVDLGFPKNADFSRSFTLQTIIYVPIPIPIMGSAGLYFGKKSSATSTEVPKIDNGTFNPVILFGVGIQFGLGYDFNSGILAAGFSLTFVTIIEGVIAKFNPYQPQNISTGEQADIAPAYYYSIKGVVGIQGKLYGYVDFKIIKAEVNVFISVLADITITAYQPILLGLTASVSVSVSIKIDLGLFSITISFSFSMTIRQSYEIQVGGGSAPWHVAPQSGNSMVLQNAVADQRIRMASSFVSLNQDPYTDTPTWSNLTAPATKAQLTGYIGLGLSMAGDLAAQPSNQPAVYSAMLFIDSVASATQDPTSAKQKALGKAPDTSFETLAKQVFRWVIAAYHNGAISAADVDQLIISKVRLKEIYDYLNDSTNTNPIPVTDINNFLTAQVMMTVSHPSDNSGSANATYFPIAPQMSISLPAFDTQPQLAYTFAGYNVLSENYIETLRKYFDELAVQMQQGSNGLQAGAAVQNDPESMGTFIFADYFLLLGRQMVQNAMNALDSFLLPITSGQTVTDVVNWVNTNGQFTSETYSVDDLFESNKSHVLTTGKPIKVNNATYGLVSGDTFTSVASNSAYNSSFTAKDLATLNQGVTTILQSGTAINYPSKDPVVVQAGNSLSSLAKDFGVTVSQLLDNTNILTLQGLLLPSAKLMLPPVNALTQASDTLVSFSARYGVSIQTLAAAPENGAIVDLFDIKDNNGNLVISNLPQFKVGTLIQEIQADNGLQQLSGMASRYYLSGLRLPTGGITPKYQGMWVNAQMQYLQTTSGLFALTGQQFPIPVLNPKASYTVGFTIPAGGWMIFSGGANTLNIAITEGTPTYSQINTVRNYAKANYLDLAIEQLGIGDMFNSSMGHYSFSTVSPWQVGAPLILPCSSSGAGSQSVNIWTLPNDLISLADPTGRAVTPSFNVEIGVVDPATKAVTSTDVTNYGWGTQVTFTVKKVPLSADSPASATTYEISGADGNNALILEQMVTYLNKNDSLVNLIAFGYTPNQSNGSNPGIQTDPINDLTIGIAQANLSTFTRPDSSFKAFAAQLQAQSQESNLLNMPTALITLLWQASITRDGGYYLYYYNSENGEGLPDHAFNDKGEALLSLITIYNTGTTDLLQPCMNVFVTGNPVNISDNTIFAQANPVEHTVTFKTGDTLSSLSFQYFTNIGDIVADNPGALLTPGKDIVVSEGTYQVRSASGETLQSVATKFNTNVDAIKAANPLVNNWPATLPQYMALRLPSLTIKAGADAYSKTFPAISLYYGMDLTSLAYYNSNVVDVFVVNTTSLIMRGGPVTRVATVPAGVVSLEAIRTEPADVPKPTDPNYALLFLQHNFSILSFSLIDNSWFKASNPSLPAGPTDSKPVVPKKWIFKQSVPYYKFANLPPKLNSSNGLPDISTSPYKGIGYLVEADFEWCDIYGNTILTTLAQPQGTGVINEAPILTGYTDALLAVNQWPSVSSAWQVANTSGNQIQIPLSFDTTRYNGLLSAKATNNTTIVLTFTTALDPTTATAIANYKLSPALTVTAATLGAGNTVVTLTTSAMANDIQYTVAIGNIKDSSQVVTYNGQATYSYPDVPAEASSSIIQQAQHDFQVYTQLWYQLTDPGIVMTMQTSLFDTPFPVSTATFNDLVNNWIASIYLYLQDRSTGGISVAAPALQYMLSFNIDPTKVNAAQIFEVVLSLSIQRTGGAIMGEFETTGGIKQVTTTISPSTAADKGSTTKALNVFAGSFEKVMSVNNQYNLKIATGADRDKLGQQTPDGTIWAVKLGVNNVQPIAYSVDKPGDPALFAPRPVSNKLESRPGVNIYTYSTGTGINFNTPSYQKDFTEIDLDQWVGSFFGSVDNILTPEFTASIQLIDKKLSTGYLKSIQDSKESLSDIAKKLMVAVFEGEVADPTAVQEALKQALLVKLTNLYATNSGIQFGVNVKADPSTGTPPNLYGNFIQSTVFEGAVSQTDTSTIVVLHFSAPLDKNSATNVSNYTLSGSLTIGAATQIDSQTVQLQASAAVVIGTTTVTIAGTLVDVNQRPVQGNRTQTIATNYVSYSKPDQLTITSAKISLANTTVGALQPLAFLLTTPEIVRGQEGEVLSQINLNLNYKATDIEHQIAAPINGFTPSSWLSFVLPDSMVEPLESKLGGFSVPMFLRSFPQNPSLDNQSGVAPNIGNPDISKLLEWNYIFNYSQPFHYPQDTLNFTVKFNVGVTQNLRLMEFPDAFNQLAEFITVYPSIDVDLKNLVAKIDAKVYYETGPDIDKLFHDAGVAMSSFTQITQHIVDAAKSSGLTMSSHPSLFTSMGDALPYSFKIQEGPKSLNGQYVQVVTISGKPPAGVGIPQVLISPDTYNMVAWTNTEDPCNGDYCYYYTKKSDGSPLLSSEAQSIQPRQVVLPALNILQRQDAMTTVFLTRNQNLIHGKTTSEVFVYTTGELAFSNPFLLTISSEQEIDIANLPSNTGSPTIRTLFDQLKVLMNTLLAENTEPTLSFQMTCSYEYGINPYLTPISLPVVMQTIIPVTIATGLDGMLQSWANNIKGWYAANQPNQYKGTFRFELVIFSNLTQQPYPLIVLNKLLLSLTEISDMSS